MTDSMDESTATAMDFLKVDGEVPELDDAKRAIIHRVLLTIGPTQPVKGSKAAKELYANKLQSALTAAAVWTGNEVWNIACCEDEKKISSFDWAANHYSPPSYQFKGNTMVNFVLKYLKQCHDAFVEKENERIKSLQVNDPLPSSDFGSLESLLKSAIRWHLQCWHINKDKTREESFKISSKWLFEKCTDKVKPPQAMKLMVDSHKKKLLFDELMALPRTFPERPGSAVTTRRTNGATNDEPNTFTADSNEEAQHVIEAFLQAHGFKWKQQDHLCNLTALQVFINDLPNSRFKNDLDDVFSTMVPLQDQNYLDRKNDREEKQAKLAEKEQKAAENRAKKEEKNKKKLEEQKSAVEAWKKRMAQGPAPAPAPEPTRKRKTRLPVQTKVSKEERAEQEKVNKIDHFIHHILPGYTHCQVPVEEAPCDSAAGQERNDTPQDHGRPKKLYQKIEKDKADVAYINPGKVYALALSKRFSNIRYFIDIMWQHNQRQTKLVVDRCTAKVVATSKDNLWIPREGLVTAAAVFLHASPVMEWTDDDDDGSKLFRPDNICVPCLSQEKQFSMDLKATATSYVSPMQLSTFPLELTVFYQLAMDSNTTKAVLEDPKFTGIRGQILELLALVDHLSLEHDDGPVFEPFITELACVIPDYVGRERRQARSRQNMIEGMRQNQRLAHGGRMP